MRTTQRQEQQQDKQDQQKLSIETNLEQHSLAYTTRKKHTHH